MALQFRAPNQIQPAKTKEEALAETLGPAIQSLPQLYMQHKLNKEKMMREDLQQRRELGYKNVDAALKLAQAKRKTVIANPLTGAREEFEGLPAGYDITWDKDGIPQFIQPGATPTGTAGVAGDNGTPQVSAGGGEIPTGFGKVIVDKQEAHSSNDMATTIRESESRKAEQSLRKEYQHNNRKYVDSVLSYRKAVKLLARKEAVADTQLTFELAKAAAGGGMLSDQERQQFSQKLGGINEQIAAKYFGVTKGTKFTDAMRDQVLNVLHSNYDEVSRMKDSLRSQYSDMAKRKGFDVENVIIDPSDVADDIDTGKPRIKTQEQYDDLPVGSRYIDSEGNEGIKQ